MVKYIREKHMTTKDVLRCKYTAIIKAIDLKEGMLLIDEDDCDDPHTMTHVFEVSNVVVTEELVSWREIAFDDFPKRTVDFNHGIYRTYEEPEIPVYFPTIKKGLEFGIKRKDIKRVLV